MKLVRNLYQWLLLVLAVTNFTANAAVSDTQLTTDRIASYQTRGVFKSFDSKQSQATIAHEAIPGYMPAMTMNFDVRNPGEFQNVQPGDAILFQLCVTTDYAWIEQVHRTESARPLLAPDKPVVSSELKTGDLLPDIELTNESGKKIRLSDFRGKVLAITFIYTGCPLPTYCPLMNRNFQTSEHLLSQLGIDEACHLLSISMDPAHDTPENLSAYAKIYDADAERWTFANASEDVLHKLGGAVGLEFKKEEGRIEHNLRTVVVDAEGRIRRIFRGNSWTPQELVAEVRLEIRSHR